MEPNYLELRKPCESCKGTIGTWRVSGMNRPVHCANCATWQNYHATRAETGEERISVRSTSIPSSQRQRILERDGSRCVFCGRTSYDGVTLQVDHLISRHDCVKYGIGSIAEMNDDANLASSCDECNLGKGKRSIAPTALIALSIRIATKRRAEGKKDGVA